MVTYRFKVSFEDFDDVVREIDIKTTQTFEDLHIAIHKSTGYNHKKASSFYVSTDNWLKGDEIAFMPSDRKVESGVAIMGDSKIKRFIEDPHQKFYYTYNFERPFDFHVELVKIILDANESLEYPYIFKSVGEAPKIFDKSNLADSTAAAAVANSKSSEFDFLNELNFVPEDADELEALSSSGINEKEDDEHTEEFDSEDEQEEEGYDSEYGSDSEDNY